MNKNKNLAIVLGLIAALFFAVTFVLNRLMSTEGGSWIWSSSFRFFFMVPLLFVIVLMRKGIAPLIQVMKQDIGSWVLWSTIGFGIFYAPITFSALYAPAWIVASTWQVTIIAGVLIAPLLSKNKKVISGRAMGFSLIILIGIAIMQIKQATTVGAKEIILGVAPVLIAAFAYPIGNRKMMAVTKGQLDAFQRTLGMTIASLPFWVVLSTIGIFTVDLPEPTQLTHTLIVALSSGVIATSIFFKATDLAHHDHRQLASVEATQSGEVFFALIGEILILGAHLPDIYSMIGIGFVVLGMILHSLKH